MTRARGIGRRPGVPAVRRRHHARVGDSAPVALPGFVPIFQGWNVWDVWQADDPDTGLLGSIWTAGESQERILRAWVEDQIKDNAPGAAVADPANPAALKGDQIQIIPQVPTVSQSNSKGLSVVATREDIPTLAGEQQIGKSDSKATLVTVRFWNRGAQTTMPWAHDANFLLDRVYLPSAQNSVTNSPAPSSLAGSASGLADTAGTVIKVVAIGAGVVLASALILSLASMNRKAAA